MGIIRLRMPSKFTPAVLHPFLLAAFPVVFLYSHNVGQVPPGDPLRSLLAALAAAAALLLLLGRGTRDLHRAGLAVSALLALFFSFGHAYTFLTETDGFSALPLARLDVLLALWAVALILLPWLALRKMTRRTARDLTPALNWMGAALLVMSSVNMGAFLWNNLRAGAVQRVQAAPAADVPAAEGEKLPDIFYIILDGFGRADTLEEIYGVDSSAFLDGLRRRGFFVAEESYSNYGQTKLSMSSSLNYNFTGELLTMRPENNDREPLDALIWQSRLADFLESRGYEVIYVPEGFKPVTVNGEVVQLDTGGMLRLNDFEAMLLRGSLALPYIDATEADVHRENVRYKLRLLPELARRPGPKFVLVHVLSPHPPFIFGPNGEAVGPFGTSADGSSYNGTDEEYLEGYRGQVQYVQRLALETVEGILDAAPEPPVIIVQGDHGPGLYLDHESADNSCLRERFAILNAYHLPGADPAALYPGISPVNTFRVVLNQYFGQELELLPDRSYFAPWSRPYDHTEITGRVGSCTVLAPAAP